jgi:hypothetical protein
LVQRVEIGNAIDAEDDGLAIDDELLVPVPQRALDNPREAPAPVMAVAGEQAHAIAAGHDRAVAVVLDFVEPVGSLRNDFAAGREAGRIGASHPTRICARARKCEIGQTRARLEGATRRGDRGVGGSRSYGDPPTLCSNAFFGVTDLYGDRLVCLALGTSGELLSSPGGQLKAPAFSGAFSRCAGMT